jgi:hypothetical protein
MYYLVEKEYLGPDRRDSSGKPLGDARTLYIQLEPGRTNVSNEPRDLGWLGTTNDIDRWARGAFRTLEEARQEARKLGFTEPVRDFEPDDEVLEAWVSPEAAREQWDAADWLQLIDPITEYNVTFENLNEKIEEIEEEARREGIELHFTREHLVGLLERSHRMQ